MAGWKRREAGELYTTIAHVAKRGGSEQRYQNAREPEAREGRYMLPPSMSGIAERG